MKYKIALDIIVLAANGQWQQATYAYVKFFLDKSTVHVYVHGVVAIFVNQYVALY